MEIKHIVHPDCPVCGQSPLPYLDKPCGNSHCPTLLKTFTGVMTQEEFNETVSLLRHAAAAWFNDKQLLALERLISNSEVLYLNLDTWGKTWNRGSKSQT